MQISVPLKVSPSCLPSLPPLLPICHFLFPYSDHHHYARPSSLLSSRCPSLLPSILQMLVGSRTISRGSWWPAAPSLRSLPAIVPGPTPDWFLHSINHTHTDLITTEHCSDLHSVMGETQETWLHAWLQDILGNVWPVSQRYPVIARQWLGLFVTYAANTCVCITNNAWGGRNIILCP